MQEIEKRGIKMTIISRVKDLFNANINAMLDDCEDPIKMTNQYLINAREDLRKLKDETIDVIAEEKRCERNLHNVKAQITRFENLAKKAIAAGNDGDAKIFIEKKQKFEEDAKVYETALNAAHENAEKMKVMHDKLVDDIRVLEDKKKAIEQKMALADAQERINSYKGASKNYAVNTAAFDRMEEKANRMLDKAMSRGTLTNSVIDGTDKLEAKYDDGINSVEAELKRMKEELN